MILLLSINLHAFEVEDLLDRKEVKEKIAKELAKLDIKFSVSLLDKDILEGANISSEYNYEVEPSYQDKFYTRTDKWNLDFNIDAGTIIKDHLELPFGFNVKRDSNFIFVRQFPNKKSALGANAYYPNKLPINAERALKLKTSDFVAIPATLNLAFTKGISTAGITDIALTKAEAGAFFVVSGEFTIQIYKLDEKHVRLKMISNRNINGGLGGGIKSEVQISGFKIFASDPVGTNSDNNGFGARADAQLKKQTIRLIDRIIDRELFNFGINYTPGASYIADYIFDLTDEEAKAAYNQILSNCYKLKGIVVIDNFLNAKDLSNNLYTTTSKADKIAARDRTLPIENRKVIRIFKGFNNYKSFNRGFKIGALFASYRHNTSYVENKLSLMDKFDHTLEFFYPNITKYYETKFAKGIFELKDQDNKVFFGLIPRQDSENIDYRAPDIGLTYERKDKIFKHSEFKKIRNYMMNQIPEKFMKQIDFNKWSNDNRKIDSRVFFQVVLKAQGFNYLKLYTQKELYVALFNYLKNKKLLHINSDGPDEVQTRIFNDRFDSDINPENYDPKDNVLPNIVESSEIFAITSLLYHALNDSNKVSEKTLTEIVKLNEIPLFLNVGLGFLVSLLPEDKLDQFVYVKLDMSAAETEGINKEFGTLNYNTLYKEINIIQSRLNNRSYDLRITKDDLEMEEKENEVLHLDN